MVRLLAIGNFNAAQEVVCRVQFVGRIIWTGILSLSLCLKALARSAKEQLDIQIVVLYLFQFPKYRQSLTYDPFLSLSETGVWSHSKAFHATDGK